MAILDAGGFPAAGGPALVDRLGNPISSGDSPRLRFMYPRWSGEFTAAGGETHIDLGAPVRSITYNKIKVFKNQTKLADSTVTLSGQRLTFGSLASSDIVAVSYYSDINTLVVDSLIAVTQAGWNPSDKYSAITLSNTLNSDALATDDNWGSVRGVTGINATTGKYYIEFTCVATADSGAMIFGIANSSASLTSNLGAGGGKVIATQINGTNQATGVGASGFAFSIGSVTAGQTGCLAIDFGAGKCWWRMNTNTWPGSGDPTTGANATQTFTAGLGGSTMYVAGSVIHATTKVRVNTGFNAYVYTQPTGYSNWAT